MQRIVIALALGVLLMGFQNCQKAAISAADSQSKLTPVVQNDPEDVSGTLEQPATPEDPVDPNAPPVEVPPAPPAGPGNGNGNGGNPNAGHNGNSSDYTGNYVCILEGPGKSVKLGMSTEGVLRGQNKIPQVLCMSKNACLNIASQAFGVKGPYFRGYCKLPQHNPHVTHITDAELQTKVDDLLNP